ncbi:unnamed protein product [Angiostrongylus costaricensis]|uniref:ZP domain-containing protein n=1 Tax=Angiostrongylus costaricensis TaxID=334426 RepID=A0A158PFI5_ANGCS|nr:unnamed protein product [Angiostrongylus costaricensis]
MHEVRSVSTFLAGGHSVDSRSIGTEHWPLKLNVQFYEHSPEKYYAKACILTERTGQITCFMNSTFNKEVLIDECGATRLGVSSSLSMLLLTMVMVIFFVVVGVGIVFFVHHVFVKISRANKSNRKFYKQPQCASFSPSSIHTKKMNNDDDRLTVIEEEKEESSRFSPTPPTSGFESDPRSFSFNSHEYRSPPVDTVASVRGSILQTFRPAPHPL